MTIKIDLNTDICPSCGLQKLDLEGNPEFGKPVCFFCYYRGRHATTKMYLLLCMRDYGGKLDLYGIIDLLNKCRINDGRRNFRFPGVEKLTRSLSSPTNKYNILTRTQVNLKGGKTGRYFKYRYHNVRGNKFLNRYLENWDSGRPITLEYESKHGGAKWEKANSLMIREKSRAIRNKLRTGEYRRFDFLFPDGLKNNPKFNIEYIDNENIDTII